MTKLSKKNQKRLAKLVSMALMCAGGLCSLPSVASAEEVKEVTWDGSATGSTPTHVTPADAAMGVDGYPAAIYAHITNTYVAEGYKTVTLDSGASTFIVTPGYNNTTAALSGFTLNVNGGNWRNGVYGAYSDGGGDVTGNKVYIKGGSTTVDGQVIGGSAIVSGNVKDNEVHIEDGKVNHNIIGGSSVTGNSEHNIVTIKGGTISGSVIVYGGKSSNGGAVKRNEVNINLETPTTLNRIYGGYGYGGATSNNHVNIGEGSTVQYGYGSVIKGGYDGTGDVENNTVTISGTLTPIPGEGGINIYGGHTIGDNSSGKRAHNNSVTIKDNAAINTVENDNGWIYGGRADGYKGNNATENTVTISGNSTLGNAYWLIYGGSATKAANDNKVIIDGGTVYGVIYGGTGAKAANDNKVIIDGGTVNASIYGGSAGNILLGYEDSEASGNTVTIGKDATLGSDTIIYGGSVVKTEFDPTTHLPTQVPLGTANNNTVNILKAISVLSIMGGEGATSTGNTLNIGATGVTVGDLGVAGFQTIALTDALAWDNGKTVLSATNFDSDDSIKATLDISAAANLKNAGSGTMTLLASETNNDFSSLNLKYYDNNTATLNSGTSSVDVFEKSNYENEKNGVTLTYDTKHTVALDTTNYNKVSYTVTNSAVKTVYFGNNIAWNDGGTVRDVSGEGFTFNGTTAINAANLGFTGKADTALKTDGSSYMTLVKGATGITDTNLTPVTEGNGTVDVSYEDAGKIKYAATASGTVSVDATAGDVKYTVDKVTLSSVDIGGWNGTESAVPTGWTADGSVAVNNAAAITVTPTTTQTILTAASGMFADVDVTKEVAFDPVTKNGVTLTGTRTNKIKTTQTNVANDTIVYEVGKKDVKTIDIGAVKWQKDATLFDGSDTDYNYANVTALGTDNFAVTYEKPEDVAANDSMTLLKANETLAEMAEQTKNTSYSSAPVSGVTIDASITGKLAASGGKVTFTAAENKASKLTFGDVEWKDSGALLNHKTTLANVSFNGAAVDTSKIRFTNMIYLDADQQMTLVSDFGDSVGTITGDKYMVGTAFEGEGEASLEGSNLIFRTKTAAGVSEQTHKAVMGAEATMALLASGREYQSKVMDGLGDPANAGKDGTTIAVAIGGDHSRVETGSHVSANTWNAAVGVGATKETKKGTLQYGIFGEYGKASYTLHSDAGKSDGDAHYAGGGILAKWTNKHDVYAEASFRLGRVSDNANDLLRDAKGNAYGYDIDANYFGAHVGVGKMFNYKGGKSLDVYGKYFYTRRDGAEFDAVQHYNLDSVSSSVLRIGARYGSNDKKWNWYGGLAYEYEFDGESKGTVNGTEIRAASIKGSSVRAELGMRMDATKTNPWQTDISIYGYGGKHRGFGGSVNVASTF